MFDLQIKSDELIDAVAAATRVSSTYLIECARRLREANRGDLPPFYIREKRGPSSPLQGTRQAANLLFAALQTAVPRNLPAAIERAEHTKVCGGNSAVMEIKDSAAARWVWAPGTSTKHPKGYEYTLYRLCDVDISFVRALEFAIVAAFRAPDEFLKTWSPMRVIYDSERNKGQIVLDFSGRDQSSPLIVFNYVEDRLLSSSPGIYRESWFTGEVLAEIGRAFRLATAKAAKTEPRNDYGA